MKAYSVCLLVADVIILGYAAEHAISVDPADTLSRMGDRLLDVQTQLAQMEAQRAYPVVPFLLQRGLRGAEEKHTDASAPSQCRHHDAPHASSLASLSVRGALETLWN